MRLEKQRCGERRARCCCGIASSHVPSVLLTCGQVRGEAGAGGGGVHHEDIGRDVAHANRIVGRTASGAPIHGDRSTGEGWPWARGTSGRGVGRNWRGDYRAGCLKE